MVGREFWRIRRLKTIVAEKVSCYMKLLDEENNEKVAYTLNFL